MRTLWRRITMTLVVTGMVAATTAAAQVPVPAVSSQDVDPPATSDWQMLPSGALFSPYLAGEKESRMSWAILRERDRGVVWDMAVGARVGLFRKGTDLATGAQGWQIDLEGAAMPRLDPEASNALEAVDYRVGLLWTGRRGNAAVKAGYYHLSAHLGDEFLVRHPEVVRLDYVRDSALVALMYDVQPNLQVYAEAAYAFIRYGGAKPLEFQVGAQYGAAQPTTRRGAPVAGLNVHLRQELDFGGGVNVMAGWGWFSAKTAHRIRVGVQAYAGRSLQYSTFRRREQMIGTGVWFDF